jgi:hypothetical protein
LTNANEVREVVDGFSNKRSYGADSIPVSIMKACIEPVTEVLSQIINSSFSSGCFPNELKIAKVCPVFKSGSKLPSQIIGQFLCYPVFLKFLKKSCIRD